MENAQQSAPGPRPHSDVRGSPINDNIQAPRELSPPHAHIKPHNRIRTPRATYTAILLLPHARPARRKPGAHLESRVLVQGSGEGAGHEASSLGPVLPMTIEHAEENVGCAPQPRMYRPGVLPSPHTLQPRPPGSWNREVRGGARVRAGGGAHVHHQTQTGSLLSAEYCPPGLPING